MLTCPNCQTKNPSGSIQCAACSTSLSPVELKKGTCLFNNTLKITQVLGQGGFGIVYKALHLQHNKFVAVKELFQEDLVTREANQVKIRGGDVTEWQAAILQTQHEFLMLQRLKHESSTKVFAQWQENGTIYTAMELLNGQTLEERIEHQQFLSLSEAKRTLVTLLEVLQELHELGYLHQDIKPSNIMLTSERVELIDFGSLSKFKKGERTKVTNRMLTPEYAPLEQYGSEVVLSPATDLYALAATFCEAITGTRVPNALERLKGASIAPVIARVQQFSSELAMILERALELRLDKRYANTQAMLSALWNPKPIILPAPPEKPEPDYTNLLVVGFFLVLFSTLGVKAIIDGFKWNSSKAGEPPLKRTKTLEEGSRTASVLLKESVTQLELSSDGQVLAAVRSYEYSKKTNYGFWTPTPSNCCTITLLRTKDKKLRFYKYCIMRIYSF
jgi:serine/threonine protein kinase